MLLSKIVDNLYSLQYPQTDIFITNLEQLKNYSENIKDEKYSDSKKFVIKLYDYIKLSNNQNIKVEKFVKEYFDSQIKDAKTNLNDEVKTIQNQYIVILGIFASFIVTFVGGLSFSSSVSNGISSISIYRLIVVILLLGFILFTICFSLYWFLAHIIIKIDTTNLNGIYRIAVGVFVILLIICFAFWQFGAVENRNKRFVSTSISTYSEIASLK